ncbi:molybdate ABC transporter substrate-binding protein [Herbaspirillum sp. RTI4]|uniref:molybdate ABC transporter substrate-binding protein n=1 Tax=Herbaspirillum sp. RTI4 TaxID=3048640 RepID=UPI002AB5B1CE|nr:molybdate ABC transporter substrate-binding protein [Herbaspirillum sp. RTI4]MDY7578250.1 molybdate ABC transporter substrate-binding protein [Herbaspirillum sp. RTI4]MEA9983477.1 molybdate ABC transporter substrate-binding protein [Herbaspirillum sp. RTI4]
MTTTPVRFLLTAFSALAFSAAFSATFSAAAQADEVQVAVAANFAAPLKLLAADFQKATGHQVQITVESTGKLYAQISNGAPFDILLAADEATPARLEKEQQAVAGSRFTYASGTLVLWSASPTGVDSQGEVLKQGRFQHLAIAAPKLAPYGAAALETLTKLKLLDGVQAKLVQGESIGQTYSFIASGAAELGFVALSQVMENGKLTSGSAWIVPAALHAPIRQDAVLLMKGKDHPAAIALLDYLRSAPAKSAIRSFGYTVP